MNIKEKQMRALDMIEEQKQNLLQLTSGGNIGAIGEKLKRWKQRTEKMIYEKINPAEKDEFLNASPPRVYNNEADFILSSATDYENFLDVLGQEISKYPEVSSGVEK